MYSILWVAEVHRWLHVCKAVWRIPFFVIATQTLRILEDSLIWESVVRALVAGEILG